MADPRSAALFAALRAAARVTDERFLVGLARESDRTRISGALAVEGQVVERSSSRQALEVLADDSFEITILDVDGGENGGKLLSDAKELRPLTDLIFCADAETALTGELFIQGATAVLPRPLPESEALLRAHARWLASCRRSRTRGLLLGNAVAKHREELQALEPALAQALSGIMAEAAQPPTVLVMGDSELTKAVGGTVVGSVPDVVVLGVTAADSLETRMQEARARAAGAALLVVDAAPTPDRLSAALYRGGRGYLPRTALAQIGRVATAIAVRRRGELTGRRLVETLARFGALDDRDGVAPAPSKDVDARLIADATARGGPFVPSGHEVLLVDDEVVVLTVLREALRRGGYRVTTAASGEEAIELMKVRSFDLVLTDKNLPGVSGLEVLRAARALDPAPAVVLITGYSSYDSAVEALDIGALDYIEKPIRDVESLRYRIRRALSRRDEHMSRPQPAEPDGTGRVLLVELEGGRRRLIAEFLGRSYQVTTAADGDEALALLQKQRYDVVLADRNLPGMSGLRVIEQAQRLLPHCASVLYTAYPSYESVKEAFELGVDAYLVRPSEDLRALAEKVARALRSRGGILLG